MGRNDRQEQELDQQQDESAEESAVELVSKSEMKRHMQGLQTLGERLAATPDVWPELDLPDRLIKALRDASTITAHEARRRHLQFIGKLMKTVDDEAVSKALELRESSSDLQKNIHHEAERWRERWLDPSLDDQTRNALLTEFVDQYPQVDVQSLRQTLRNTLKDIELKRNRGNTKKLYQIARDGIATMLA